MRSFTTQSGNILWTLDNGRLCAQAQGSPGTWFSAQETLTLATMLATDYENIKQAALREQQGHSQTYDAYHAQRRVARVRQQEALQEGATGIEG